MTSDRLLWLFVLLLVLAVAGSRAVGGLLALARAIAHAEGYGIPGAIPTVRNNPGNLKLPSSDGAITTFPTAAEGWAALERQLRLILSGQSRFYNVGMSIADMASVWTATEQTFWARNVADWLQRNWRSTVTEQTTLREILT